MKTTLAKTSNAADKTWFVVDATDQPVGRLAVKIATILRGRHKPTYTPHVDTGDFVVVINADKAKFTGNKETDKPIMSMIDREFRDEKAVKNAINRIFSGEYTIVENEDNAPEIE